MSRARGGGDGAQLIRHGTHPTCRQHSTATATSSEQYRSVSIACVERLPNWSGIAHKRTVYSSGSTSAFLEVYFNPCTVSPIRLWVGAPRNAREPRAQPLVAHTAATCRLKPLLLRRSGRGRQRLQNGCASKHLSPRRPSHRWAECATRKRAGPRCALPRLLPVSYRSLNLNG